MALEYVPKRPGDPVPASARNIRPFGVEKKAGDWSVRRRVVAMCFQRLTCKTLTRDRSAPCSRENEAVDLEKH
jgi:hypothetical protein